MLLPLQSGLVDFTLQLRSKRNPSFCFLFFNNSLNFSGLDVVQLLESLGISEKIISPLRTSSVGYYALTYALYKVASPARYAVTIGGKSCKSLLRYIKK